MFKKRAPKFHSKNFIGEEEVLGLKGLKGDARINKKTPEKELAFDKLQDLQDQKQFSNYQSLSTINNLPSNAKIQKLIPTITSTNNPLSVFGEFSNLNPRYSYDQLIEPDPQQQIPSHNPETTEIPQQKIKPERIVEDGSSHLSKGVFGGAETLHQTSIQKPVQLRQDNFQTQFESEIRPETFTKTNIQPFIYFPAKSQFRIDDNLG